MYKCDDCQKIFDEEKEYTDTIIFEGKEIIQSYGACPYCKGNYDKIPEKYNIIESSINFSIEEKEVILDLIKFELKRMDEEYQMYFGEDEFAKIYQTLENLDKKIKRN